MMMCIMMIMMMMMMIKVNSTDRPVNSIQDTAMSEGRSRVSDNDDKYHWQLLLKGISEDR